MEIKNFNVKISEYCIVSIGAYSPEGAIKVVKERYDFLIKECDVDPNTITIEHERLANKRFE